MKKTGLITLLTGASLLFGCSAETGMPADEAQERVGRTGQALTPASDRVPLVTFFSAARGDYFSTTQPAWTCKLFTPSACPADPSYAPVGLAGYVFRADRPQPAGTVPLYHWWSPSRGDNFLTSNPAWAGSVGDIRLDSDGYQLFRIEGFISSTTSLEATVALRSFWNPAERDNAAVVVRPDAPMPAAWGASYRREGFLLGPSTSALPIAGGVATGGNKCLRRLGSNYTDSPPWTAWGNFINTWSAPMDLFDGDALQIGAAGYTRIDFWGANKSVAGEGPAPAGWPLPGEPAYGLIGRVTSGRIWVPGRGSYRANTWFPIGAGTQCLEYDSQGTTSGDLQVMINDTNISDNGGGPSVTVQQWW